jgi:hypothetical protein
MLRARVPWRRDAIPLAERTAPQFFEPLPERHAEPFALVDIDACFASIYSRLTLDVTYRPDCNPPLLGLGRVVWQRRDEWVAAKGPRNSVCGMLKRPRLTEWRRGEERPGAANRFFAPDLYGVIMDVANAIAEETCEQFRVTSWATDGGVIHEDDAAPWIAWLAARWGLVGSVRAAGPGWVFGCNSWSVGPDQTGDVAKGRSRQWGPTDRVRRSGAYLRDMLAETMRGRS